MSFRGYGNDVDTNCGVWKPSKKMRELLRKIRLQLCTCGHLNIDHRDNEKACTRCGCKGFDWAGDIQELPATSEKELKERLLMRIKCHECGLPLNKCKCGCHVLINPRFGER